MDWIIALLIVIAFELGIISLQLSDIYRYLVVK